MQELATKDDIKGLHMDFIRMGMAWKVRLDVCRSICL